MNGIKKAEKFVRNKEIEKDFNRLKRAFRDGGIKALPDFGKGNFSYQLLIGARRTSLECYHSCRTDRRDSWIAGEGSVKSMRRIISVKTENC